MIRVLIVDDDDLMRAGLRMIVDQADDLATVGEAADGAEVPAAVEAHRPDVILMDVRMPEVDGIEATRALLDGPRGPGHDPDGDGDEGPGEGPRVLILTTFELDEYVFAALEAGASGFLLKRTPPEQLLEAVRTVHRGEALLSPSVTRRLIDHVTGSRRRPTSDPRLAALTDREREVLVAMARGWSNTEIAEGLFIADNTVKTHVKRVLTKLGARDRVQAVVLAYDAGLMDD